MTLRADEEATGSSERLVRIQRVVDDCIDRRIAGEELSDEKILSGHHDLLPELAEELRGLGVIERARRRAVETRSGGASPRMSAAAVPPDLFTGYDMLGEIHRGGQGVVYRATQRSTKRPVAIKVSHEAALGQGHELARFEREVHILGSLQHPGIVTIHDSGVGAGGSCFFVMDYIEGRPLDDYVRHQAADGSPLPIETVLRLFIKVCDAINAAHLRGVIHRDLKPSNIRVDAQGEPRVLDFGLAKLTVKTDDPTMTQTGQFVGSLPWASPEQAEGAEDVDVRTDVYSLGVILYQLLTSQPPYKTVGSVREVMDAIIRAAPAPLSTVRPSIDNDLDTIVLKCLHKDRDRRYQSAGELARDFRHYLAGEPIEAKRDSGWYVLTKTIGRYRAAVFATAAFLFLLTGSTIALAFLYNQQATQRRRADEARSASEKSARDEAHARQLAQENAAKAGAEASKQEAVNRFLQGLLATANPKENPKGRDMTVRQAVDRAAGDLKNESLKQQPEVEAAVRLTLGSTYRELGDLPNAEKHLTRALAIREESPERQDDEIAQNLVQLATLRMEQGRMKDAEPLLRRALTIREELFGPEHLKVAYVLNDLGLVLRNLSRFDDAELLFRRALDIRRKSSGDHRIELAVSLHNLASLEDSRGHLAEAEALYREALAQRRAKAGVGDPELVRTLSNLAIVLGRLDKLPDAETTLREALLLSQQSYGQEHPMVALSMHNLAEALRNQEKFDEAEPLHQEALRMRRKLLGNEHPSVAASLTNTGSLLRQRGRYSEAEEMSREAVAMFVELLGQEHPNTAVCMHNLGLVLLDQDRLDEAEQVFREVLAIQRKALGEDNPQVAASLHNLSVVMKQQGKLSDAEAMMRDSQRIRRAKLPPEHAATTSGMAQLASILLLRSDPALHDEVRRLAEDVLSRRRKSVPAGHRELAAAEGLYGAYLTAVGHYEEAEPLVLAGYSVVKELTQVPRRDKGEALERIITLYENWGNPEKAAEWRARLATPPSGPGVIPKSSE